MEPVQANAVVTANNFNVFVFRESWLLHEGIVEGGEILQGAVFTPAIVQFSTAKCDVLVIPDRLQITPTCGAEQQAEAISRLGCKIVETIPHTPFSAAGLNFVFNSQPINDMPARSRHLFLNTNGPLASHFEPADSRFGGYFSKDFHTFRLKISILPARNLIGETQADFLQMAFNFHADVSETGMVQRIRELFGLWDQARAYSAEIAASME